MNRCVGFIFVLLVCACDDTRVYFTPSPDCENNIIAEIRRANKIDIAVYSITNKNITDAILAAHIRGAKVRVITDRLQSTGRYSRIADVAAAGVSVVTNKTHKIEHNKFAIFDTKTVVTGSYNWTENATKRNSENCIFIHDVTDEYVARFEYLWNMYTE